MKNAVVLWLLALISSVVVIHYVPGPLGAWLSVVLFVAALDWSQGISWKPWWRTALRAAGSLGICFLVAYQMAHETERARDIWTLIMAMLFGGIVSISVYRWVEQWRSRSSRGGLVA